MVDIRYTQNLYTKEENLKRIVETLNFHNHDTVIDIGAGNGIITKELVKHSTNVIAYELDSNYFRILEERFKENPSVTLKNKDFLQEPLPNIEFKIFANIPFSLTSDILNKITDTNSKLREAYLFIQKESAERYIGIPKNTQIATILSSIYELSILENFNRKDFKPIPNVDIVLLRIIKRKNPEVEFRLYRDFVTYIFNQMNSNVLDTFKKLFTSNQLRYIERDLKENRYTIPTDIPSEYYSNIFKYFKANGVNYKSRIDGYYKKHINQHIKRKKINRTRI